MFIYLKNIIGFLFIVLGTLCIVNGISAKVYHVSFSSFFLIIGIILLSLGIFECFILKLTMPSLIINLISLIHLLALLIFITFFIVETFIAISAIKKDTREPDYIVVLGAGLRGEIPSHTLYKRLESSMNLINKYSTPKIILSGGQGPGEAITEAEAMKRYLIDKGVSPDRLIKEDRSTNTLENLSFSRDIIVSLTDKNNPTITIVTSNFHMFRSKILAERVGLISFGYPAEIHPYLIPTYFIREYLALIKSLLFDWPT